MLSILEAIGQKGVITSEDVLALRAAMYGDNLISHPEAEAIIAMAHSGAQGDKTWQAFFLEALTDFVVRQSDPPGYVNAEVAGWLTSQLLSEGRPRSALSLELIVHILETAVESPDSLKEAILKAIEFSVMDGIHPGSEPLKAPNPRITDPEVGLLRRVLYAAGGDGAATISTDEADLLFRLKDATLGAENGPSWKDFFVKAIANHLMAHNFHTAISRDEALRRQAFVADTHIHIGRFLGCVIGGIPKLGETLFQKDQDPWAENHGEARIAHDEAVTASEQAWLRFQTNHDGQLDDMEKALLAYLEKCQASA